MDGLLVAESIIIFYFFIFIFFILLNLIGMDKIIFATSIPSA